LSLVVPLSTFLRDIRSTSVLFGWLCLPSYWSSVVPPSTGVIYFTCGVHNDTKSQEIDGSQRWYGYFPTLALDGWLAVLCDSMEKGIRVSGWRHVMEVIGRTARRLVHKGVLVLVLGRLSIHKERKRDIEGLQVPLLRTIPCSQPCRNEQRGALSLYNSTEILQFSSSPVSKRTAGQ
jgi:hypothetical protein